MGLYQTLKARQRRKEHLLSSERDWIDRVEKIVGYEIPLLVPVNSFFVMGPDDAEAILSLLSIKPRLGRLYRFAPTMMLSIVLSALSLPSFASGYSAFIAPTKAASAALWDASSALSATSTVTNQTAPSPSIAMIKMSNPALLSVPGEKWESNQPPIDTAYIGLRGFLSGLMLIAVGFFAALNWKRK